MKIQLIKALSYRGIVIATRENPIVEVDEAIANAAVETGYFAICDEPVDETPVEDEVEPAYGGKTLEEMTISELETFATYNNVSLKGVRTKAKIIDKLREELGEEKTSGDVYYGSPTMVELAEE